MNKLASQAVSWYNKRVNIVVLGSARNTPSWIHLLWRYIMDTLSLWSEDGNTPLKHCSSCPEGQGWHPATPEFFSRRKTSKDGLDHRCKQCAKKTLLSWRARPETQEHEQSYSSEYNHSLRGLERSKNYRNRPEKREKRTAYMQEYHDKPDVREQQYAYRRRPERLKQMCVHAANYRTKVQSLGTHTPEQIQSQLKRQKYKCYYAACGFAPFKKRNGEYIFHIEHTFPVSRADGKDPINTIDYLVLACPSCNHKKNNKYPWEFFEGGRLL